MIAIPGRDHQKSTAENKLAVAITNAQFGLECNRLKINCLTNRVQILFISHHKKVLNIKNSIHYVWVLIAEREIFWGFIVFKGGLVPEFSARARMRQLRFEAFCWLKKNVQK